MGNIHSIITDCLQCHSVNYLMAKSLIRNNYLIFVVAKSFCICYLSYVKIVFWFLLLF